MNKIIKNKIEYLLKFTPFYPYHIGDYVRNLHFWKCVKKLPIENFTCILDAGCGNGAYTKKVAEKYSHLKIDACDLKKHKGWNNDFKNIDFQQLDLLKLKKENHYDFCYSIDVLEHIPNNQKVLENIYKSLKTGGYFFLHTPSKNDERIFPKRFFKEFDKWLEEEHIGEMYNLKELEKVANSVSFKTIKAFETFGLLGSFAWEIDRITDKCKPLKIVLAPLLKLLAHLDVKFSKKGKGILILARK